jgi:hypothetical protein
MSDPKSATPETENRIHIGNSLFLETCEMCGGSIKVKVIDLKDPFGLPAVSFTLEHHQRIWLANQMFGRIQATIATVSVR